MSRSVAPVRIDIFYLLGLATGSETLYIYTITGENDGVQWKFLVVSSKTAEQFDGRGRDDPVVSLP